MAAADPVNAVAGGTDWRADVAIREFSNRTRSISNAAVAEATLDDPRTVAGEAAFREVCSAIGVGLILEDEGFRVVKLCPDKNLWLAKASEGWETVPWCMAPIGQDAAAGLIVDKARERATDPRSSMRELRRIAIACGLSKPLPRAKNALCALILRDVVDGCGGARDGAQPVQQFPDPGFRRTEDGHGLAS